MPDNVRPLTHAETAQRVGETLGSVLEDMRVRRDEIVAECDRLKALNAELVSALDVVLRRFKDELSDDRQVWEVGTEAILCGAEKLLKRAKET